MADISGFVRTAGSQLGNARAQLNNANSAVGALLERAGVESRPQEIGIGGFRTYSRIRERVNYQADIPISFVETGSPISDHRIIQPLSVSIEGVVGDIYLPQGALSSTVGRIQAEIGNVTQYLPTRTQTQISKVSALVNDAADAVRRIEALIDSGEQVLDLFRNRSVQANPLQFQFIETMESLFRTGSIFNVETRYRIYWDMVITNLMFEVNNETDEIRFMIDLQEWREASIEFVEVARNPGGGAADAVSGKQDKGVQRGDDVEQSLLTTIFEAIGIPVPGAD